MASTALPLTSAEKKRVRDRRAQQNLRDKRNRYVASLRERVEDCEKNHGRQLELQQRFQELQDQFRDLQCENKTLRQRLDQLRLLINSWAPSIKPLDASTSTAQVHPIGHCHDLPATSPVSQSAASPGSSALGAPPSTTDQQPAHEPAITTTNQAAESFGPTQSALAPHAGPAPTYTPAFGLPLDDAAGTPVQSDLADSPPPPHDCGSWFPELTLPDAPFHPGSVLELPSGLDSSNVTAVPPHAAEILPESRVHDTEDPTGHSRHPGKAVAVAASRGLVSLRSSVSSCLYSFFRPAPSAASELVLSGRASGPRTIPGSPDALVAASPWLAGFSLSHASVPVWCLTPCCNDRVGMSHGPPQQIGPWPMHGSLVNDSPDAVSPIDLLYGSKHNLLAGWIHRSLRRWTLRESERLAIGWLIYTFTKWRAEPTVERYARLPDYYRPVAEQILTPHPSYMDIMLWQRLRANTIAKSAGHDMDNVIQMLACCLKVRWPWGEDILELGDDGEVRMRQAFFDVITRVEGWGLAPEFIQAFPDLVDGLDISSIVYKEP